MRKMFREMCLGVVACIAAGVCFAGPVNINTADAETLASELTGIGPALAAAIIRDREENGPYESAEQLTRVSGVGESVLEKNRENIRVEEVEAEES